MATPTREDAQLMLQLAQWGTAMGIEDALAQLFADDFNAEAADSLNDSAVRTELLFGESIGTLTKHDLLSVELVELVDVTAFVHEAATSPSVTAAMRMSARLARLSAAGRAPVRRGCCASRSTCHP